MSANHAYAQSVSRMADEIYGILKLHVDIHHYNLFA